MITKLKLGETVTFRDWDGTFIAAYEIRPTYLCNLNQSGEYAQEKIFEYIKVNKEEFCGRAYGYEPITGKFPTYNENDFYALSRLLFELSDYCIVEINGDQWRNRRRIQKDGWLVTDGFTSTLSPSHYVSGAISGVLESTFKETAMSYIQDKFAALMLTEPTKSFKKLGILTDRNHLNEDGTALFIQYLLSVHGDAFKKDVVDVLLKEEEKKK